MLVPKHTHRLIGRDREHARCAGTHAQGRGAELNPRCAPAWPVECCVWAITDHMARRPKTTTDTRPNRRKTKRRAVGRASLPSFRRRGSEIRSFWKIHKETKVPGPIQNGWMNPGHPPLETPGPGLGSRWPPTGVAHQRKGLWQKTQSCWACARKNHTSYLGALGVQSLASHPGPGS